MSFESDGEVHNASRNLKDAYKHLERDDYGRWKK